MNLVLVFVDSKMSIHTWLLYLIIPMAYYIIPTGKKEAGDIEGLALTVRIAI